MGELAELAFMFRAAREGIGVAKPYGDSHPYDFLVQHGRRLLRVQVKSCFDHRRARRSGFSITVSRHAQKAQIPYSLDEIDYVAAFIAVRNIWYLIPVESLCQHVRIYLRPGKIPNQRGGFFEQYREAWNQLKDESAKSP